MDRIESPALRAGLTYGIISGVLILVINLLDITQLTSSSLGFLGGLFGFLRVLLAFSLLLLTALAGRTATMRTGNVGAGALAGMVADVVSTLTALPGVLILSIVAHTMAPTPFSLIHAAAFGGLPAGVVALLAHAFSAYLSLGLSAGIGALGGLDWRWAHRSMV